ncbi:hypothetical protein MK489_20030 [Myxococcota bacterium]|nr:hypothetical protein [Myxococcota bacterium]
MDGSVEGRMDPKGMDPKELEELARPPGEQIARALETSEPEALGLFDRLVGGYQSFIEGFHVWVASIQGFLYERFGPEGLALTATLEARLAAARPTNHQLAAMGANFQRERREFEQQFLAGETVAAQSVFDSLEARLRGSHDYHLDRVSLYLSHVYREYGIECLEESLRYSGERTLLRWMPKDLSREPEKRLRTWASMLLGNFATLRIEEDDQKFSLIQDPCGTCTRQLRSGAYAPPLDLALVRESHPITYGQGDLPVYRCHVAVMHFLMPIEREGVPWPVVECPRGQGEGPCRILLYKDPSRTPARHGARVGLG